METGTIKTVNDKGYGFIVPSGGGPDVFFHCSRLVELVFDERLREMRVEYQTEMDQRSGKLRASVVRPASN